MSERSTRAVGDNGAATVALIDDHEIVRSGLRSLIELEPRLSVVAEAATAEDGLRTVDATEPDLVVLDMRLPDRSGISVCREITSRRPEVKVLILTSYADDAALSAAIAARASGYLLKSAGGTELISAMTRILDGETVFQHDWPGLAHDSLLSRLSTQERAIAGFLAEGLTNRQIADRMDLSEKTVKNYVSNTLMKMGVARRSGAAAMVARSEGSHLQIDLTGAGDLSDEGGV